MKPQLFILNAKKLQHIIIEISDVAESKFHNCEEKQEKQKEKKLNVCQIHWCA